MNEKKIGSTLNSWPLTTLKRSACVGCTPPPRYKKQNMVFTIDGMQTVEEVAWRAIWGLELRVCDADAEPTVGAWGHCVMQKDCTSIQNVLMTAPL